MTELRTAAGTLSFGGEVWLMGTVDPGPDASDQAAAHVDAGARIVGVRGGPGSPRLIAGVRAALGVPVAVLTGAPEVAEAAIDAGAAMVDASGGTVVAELVAVCARRGVGLIVPLGTPDTMTAALPPTAWMSGLAATAGSTRATAAGDRPLLTHAEAPTLTQELAAVARGIELGSSVLAVSDVGAAADYLAVHDALCGRREVDPNLRLPAGLRREPDAASALEYPSN